MSQGMSLLDTAARNWVIGLTHASFGVGSRRNGVEARSVSE